MQKSESIAKLSAALVKAQKDIQHPKKTSTNPHLRNKFADLAEVINTVRPALAKHGLAIVQFANNGNDVFDIDGNTPAPSRVGVTTMLLHESGEYIADTIDLPLGEQKGLNTGQVAGSLLTYLRRYSESAVAGVASEPDDDGNEAKSNGKAPKASEAPAPTLVM